MRRPHHEHSSNPNPNFSENKSSKRCVSWHLRSKRKKNTSQTTNYRSFPLAGRPATGRACGTRINT
eukprot:scaffold72919_cov62-Phaeocystis_antarctica.AAC.2